MNPAAILALIGDLYEQIASLSAERDAYATKNAELHEELARLQEKS